MSTRSKLKVPARLARGRQRFDTFRKTHQGYRRLPESLWSAAVKLARTYGANRTANALRLDYSTLKKRLASIVSATPPESASGSGFMELLPSAVKGAPLDNNVCERALKKAILHRKNAYFYKTLNGAHVGDLLMSLIHTCELNKVNPFDYLVELQKNAQFAPSTPADWMLWNYRHALQHTATGE